MAAVLCHVDWETEYQLLVKEKNTAEVESEDSHRFQGWGAVWIKGVVCIKWDHGYESPIEVKCALKY